MTVSVGVVAHNESNVINGILEDLAKQDYPHEKIELLLVDSASTDDTGKQLEAFAARQAERQILSVKMSGFRRQARRLPVARDPIS